MTRTAGTVVAGIPIVHDVEFGEWAVSDELDHWAGTRVAAPELLVRHVTAGADLAGLRETLDARPFARYYVDGAGKTAAAFESLRRYAPRQFLRSVRAGHEYELRYEAPPSYPLAQWGRDRALFTVALTERGAGVVVHGCGFVLPDGSAILAPGAAGVGKSTLARLLSPVSGLVVLSDDRLAMTAENSGARLWGTPWFSAARVADVGDGPLRAVVVLRHATVPTIRRVTRAQGVRHLLQSVALPLWNPAYTPGVLARVDEMVRTVEFVEFGYPPTADAAEFLVDWLLEAAPHG